MCVHELVAAQASATPDAVAVVVGDRELYYGELNARANQLAYRLRSLGIRAEVPAALFLERSAELVIAALAVLKAGAAYVPLDPSYPAGRVSMLLAFAVLLGFSGRIAWQARNVVRGRGPIGWRTLLAAGSSVFLTGCGSTAVIEQSSKCDRLGH